MARLKLLEDRLATVQKDHNAFKERVTKLGLALIVFVVLSIVLMFRHEHMLSVQNKTICGLTTELGVAAYVKSVEALSPLADRAGNMYTYILDWWSQR